MKSSSLVVYTLVIALIYSFCCCTSETEGVGETNGTSLANQDDPIVDKGPISHALDTSVGYCYQMAEDGIQDVIELRIHGNVVEGQGVRVYLAQQGTYDLYVKGLLNGNEAEVYVRSTNKRKESESIMVTEQWVLDENSLTVKNRAIEGAKGTYTYVRTNCGREKNADESRYDYFGGFNEGHAVVAKKGRYGLVNEQWEVTIPLQYRDLGIVNEGSIVFYDEYSGRRGLMDVNGEVLIPADYAEIHCFNEGLAAFLSDNGRWGFFGRDLKVAIKPIFKNIDFFKPDPSRHPFCEGLAKVQTENDRWNFINTEGDIVIAGDYMFADQFKEGKARVHKDNKWFYINKSGTCVEGCD